MNEFERAQLALVVPAAASGDERRSHIHTNRMCLPIACPSLAYAGPSVSVAQLAARVLPENVVPV